MIEESPTAELGVWKKKGVLEIRGSDSVLLDSIVRCENGSLQELP